MTIGDIRSALSAEIICGDQNLNREAESAFASDMMSDVLACVNERTVLLTSLTNAHVMRTAEMLDLRCVLYVRSKRPDADALQKARELGITVLSSRYTTFDTCGILYGLGLRGARIER